MNIENYWHDIDKRIDQLLDNGYVKLPSINSLDLDLHAENIINEMGPLTFKELGSNHKKFLDILELDKYLAPKLMEVAENVFNYKGDLLNQYHIARKVEPGNSSEMYRAHFDSHLFTMVIPIKIPDVIEDGTSGDLIYFPNARKTPKNEIINFFDKIYFKRFASKSGLEKFAISYERKEDNFRDYEPLLFVGNTTLHTNHPVTKSCSSYRLTLLAHFFDPSPKYGIGSLLRLIRNR